MLEQKEIRLERFEGSVVHDIDFDVVPRSSKSNGDTDSFEAKSLT